MVLSRNDKRKRKEGDLVDLMDPLAEPAKRTKIHAQRKFAQGATTPAYSPASTPVKEKEKTKSTVFTELITHKRPNTEDFLTFLCFRGTSVLPPSLNFFNTNSKKNKSQNAIKPSVPSNLSSKISDTGGKLTIVSGAEHQPYLSNIQKLASNKEKLSNGLKKQVSTPIPKAIKLKTTSTAIQALKKKYKEQRLAKQRLKKKFKPTCMKTRSCALVVDQVPQKSATAKVVASRKIISHIENKRHGLRSTGLPESEKKSIPLKNLKKQLPLKLKKSNVVSKRDTLSIDTFMIKNNPKQKVVAKVVTSKFIRKKLLNRRKELEAKRITRSRSDVPLKIAESIPSTLTRRPTRKTKEAAAVYMEILGRKLVSPELENEDNMSLDSFPELPNARKIAQTENEIKAKVKSLKVQTTTNSTGTAVKEKEKKSNASNNKSIKRKVTKPVLPLKNRRMVKVQKYYELNSDEESVSLKEIIERTKTSSFSRRSAPVSTEKDNKLENRNLRSTRSLAPRKSFTKVTKAEENSTCENNKVMKIFESLNVIKTNKESSQIKDKEITKEKAISNVKRKRESNITDKEKQNSSKQKLESIKSKIKNNDTVADESEEESLRTILNKLKKKKENEKQESIVDIVAKKIAEPKLTQITVTSSPSTSTITSTVISTKSTAMDLLKNDAMNEGKTTKISDDEESFRGFTKKAISKVVSTCQSHAKASSGLLENIDSKTNVLKPHEIMAKAATGKDIKKADIKAISITAMFPYIKPIQEHLIDSGSTSAATTTSVKQEPDLEEAKVNKNSIPITSSTALNIIDMPKTLPHGRKERVNMSTEQIEKWLNESSLAKEESKVEMESVTNFKYDSLPSDKSKNGTMAAPSLSHGHLSISPKIQHLVRPVNVTLSKLSDRLKKASSVMSANKPTVFLSNLTGQVSPVKPQQAPVAVTKPKPPPTPGHSSAVAAKEKKEPSVLPSRKMSKDSSSFGEDHGDSDVVSKSDANSVGDSSEKKSLGSPEKKVFFHQRKPFLPRVKERKMTSSSSAFSPENESSVYAFESEAEVPVNTPFRRKAREVAVKESSDEKNKFGSSQSTNTQPISSENKSKSGEETKKVTESLNSPEEARKNEEKSSPLLERTTPKNFELPKNFSDLTNVQVLPLDKLTTSWSNVNYSASIAVQVNLDDQKQQQQKQQQSILAENNEFNFNNKSTEISTQTDGNTDNDDDNDSGQLFYIPLQAVTRNTSAQGGQQLIQGVAVKLGTEGPTGPNQRVLLKAKLVTKPPISVARCPPIGTVQPTARMPQNVINEQVDLPSTSRIETGNLGFKFQRILEKGVKTTTIGTKQINKTSSPEKIIKSPKSNAKERKSLSDGSKGLKKAPGKAKNLEIHTPINKTTFPKMKECNDEARLVEAPTFQPSEKDFQDPLEYIDKIRPIAEKFGICKVIPPSNFKPECKVSDDMRFTAYNHYIHRMLHRWGPNVKEMMAIKKYLATQSITLTQPPWIGGMEVDLPHLYQTVQNLGGLKEVIEKKKWQKVADGMKIPRSAQDRVTKLDDIYCKYLLPYDTLSQDERDKLFKDVEAEWIRREKRDRQEVRSTDTEDEDEEDSTDEIEECIVKGRNMPLNAFYRIARNTQRMWFGENQRTTNETDGASVDEVETSFWKHVVEKKRHVCVHAASIDSSGRGFGFSVAKNSPFGRHPWNLKILTNNAGSVLRALGPQMGVTVPTLHVGMLFSACCWYRDPHGLPWIEYLHTGAKKIWYGIPNEQNNTFRKALTKMFPRYCKNKTIWLPSDTAMVPPDMLVNNGVPLCQTVQEPGQFIVVFPKAFTSSICTGYVVSESVYFAQLSWLETAEQVFRDIYESCEPSIFSFERLLFSIINDSRSHIDVLKQILPTVINVYNKEIQERKKLKDLGLTNTEKLPLPESDKKGKNRKIKEAIDYECDTCRANLFVSLVSNPTDESIFCLTHAIQYVETKKHVLKNCTLMYTYSENELNDLIHKLKDRIEAKSKKTNQTKHAK